MSGLDPKVAVHHLAVKESIKPINQAQRRFHPELVPSIEAEVNNLIEAGFVREVQYPTWLANIVLVRKFMGFVVRSHRIEIDEAKIDDITALP
ncbi:hypothetical protein LIER_12727 [Lithospermum erythrorhizon]|uniref:Uncharacterized protein n=1 Tax=Lithospermum erythrorhizon TaxID=34254 RepID=A0AAV3PUE2_LITER